MVGADGRTGFGVDGAGGVIEGSVEAVVGGGGASLVVVARCVVLVGRGVVDGTTVGAGAAGTKTGLGAGAGLTAR